MVTSNMATEILYIAVVGTVETSLLCLVVWFFQVELGSTRPRPCSGRLRAVGIHPDRWTCHKGKLQRSELTMLTVLTFPRAQSTSREGHSTLQTHLEDLEGAWRAWILDGFSCCILASVSTWDWDFRFRRGTARKRFRRPGSPSTRKPSCTGLDLDLNAAGGWCPAAPNRCGTKQHPGAPNWAPTVGKKC